MQMRGRKYFPYEGAFANPLSDEAQYWTGFLAADGCVFPLWNGSMELRCELADKDVGHLFKMAEFFHLPHDVVKVSPKRALLRLTSEVICGDLMALGITPRKTKTLSITNESLLRSPHFWRGMVDGDGCISSKVRVDYQGVRKPRGAKGISFTVLLDGTKNMAEKFVSFIGSGTVRPHGSIWRAQVGGNTAARKALGILYAAPTPALDRKLEKARTLLALA
jgi:hypothetical protein